MQWNRTYGGTGTDWPYSVVQTSDGGCAIAGETGSFVAGYFDAWLVKTDCARILFGNLDTNVGFLFQEKSFQ